MSNDNRIGIPFAEFTGTREEIGASHGEHYSHLIHDLLGSRTELLMNEFPDLTKDHLEEVCHMQIDAVERQTPNIFREVNATARACSIPTWKMVVCGGYTDLLDIFKSEFVVVPSEFSECTTIVQAQNGQIMGTWDSNSEALNSSLLLRRHISEDETTVLALTTAGWPAQQGVNSHGLSFAINNLMPSSSNLSGLNYIAANAVLAESRSTLDFVEFCRASDFAAGHAYVVADTDGKAAVIFTTCKDVAVHWIDTNYVLTNHYLPEARIDDNSAYPYLEGSIDRYSEMAESHLEEPFEKTLPMFLSTSKFVNKDDPNAVAMTCAHFVADARRKAFFLRRGPASGEALIRVDL